MQKNLTLIIDNLLTPYIVSRYNEINTVLDNNLEVWFQANGDVNRHWTSFPKIKFKYLILEDTPIRLKGEDTHTFHINSQVINLLREKKPYLKRVILCGWDSFAYLYTAWYCTTKGIPYTLWSGSTLFEQSWRRVLFWPVIKMVVSYAADYIVYGTRAKTFLQSLGAKSEKINVFYNSVDVNYFLTEAKKLVSKKEMIRKKFKLRAHHYVFLFVGQLIERKGIPELLKAFTFLQEKRSDCSLLIVGNGILEKEIKNLKVPNIRHLSHREYNQMPEVYAAADCLILPSKEEVWGLVVNEAMASSLPVIVSNRVGASEDMVVPGRTGYTYQSGNIHQLREYMELMIDQKKDLRAHTIRQALKTNPKLMAQSVFKHSL